MDNDRPYRSLEQIEREIQEEMRSLGEVKIESEWINEFNKTDRLGSTSTKTPKYNKNISYYEQFWKTYLINEMIILKAKQLTIKNQSLNSMITNVEELLKERSKMLSEKHQKKKRRTSSEINKTYKCPYQDCNKKYGCDVSMNLHIKLKHEGGNKTEREQLAREICEAEINGGPKPEVTLTFPPGYLEAFKEEYKMRLMKTGNIDRKV